MRTSPFIAPVLILSGILLTSCSSLEIASRRTAEPVQIDGRNTEWGDSLTLLEGKGITVGFNNDDTFLNLIMTTSDRTLQQRILGRGITFWFDPAGGTEKKFGVHYPAGRGSAGGGRSGDGTDEEENRERMPDMRQERDDARPGEVVIYYGEKEQHRMTLAEASGIEIELRPQRELLVYEMRIPLRESGPHPFAIGFTGGSVVGVGIDGGTDRPNRREESDTGRGGGMGEDPNRMPGGEPGMPGENPEGRGMRPPGGRQGFEGGTRDQSAINVWMKVKLAGK